MEKNIMKVMVLNVFSKDNENLALVFIISKTNWDKDIKKNINMLFDKLEKGNLYCQIEKCKLDMNTGIVKSENLFFSIRDWENERENIIKDITMPYSYWMTDIKLFYQGKL